MSTTTDSGDTLHEAGFAPIVQLPHELLFEIVSLLSEPSDLLSLSLSCRTLSSHVIPYHTDYRILHVRTLNPTLFAHLARRTDLTRNIREVHISEKHNYTRGDRMPRKLVDLAVDGDPKVNGSGIPGPDGERLKALNVCKALRSMSDLRSFTWEWNGVYTEEQTHGYYGSARKRIVVRPTTEPRFEDAILAEVARKSTLKHFGLSGPFGAHVSGLSLDNKYEYPVWHLSNLTSLDLSGDTWLKTSNILPLCIMLSRSPNLECLVIPLEFRHLPVVILPKLKKVKLHLLSGGTANVDASAAAFIENHPSIEELSWYPIEVPRLRKGVLPNLRHLKSTAGVMKALVESDARADEEEQPMDTPITVVESPSVSAQPQTAMLAVTSKTHKRLSMIQEAEEPEDVQDDEDNEATPPATRHIELTEDDDDDNAPSSPSSGAQYASFAQGSSSSPPASPMITLTAPPSTPTSLYSSQQQSPSHRRRIETLDMKSLSAQALLTSAPSFIDRHSLQKLSLYTFGVIQDLHDLADMFPNIRWLSLPSIHLPLSSPHPVPFTISELLDVLPKFKQLEVFRGSALWRAAGSTSEEGKRKVHEALGMLVQMCPRLKEVDHCDWYERRMGFKRVVVTRDVVPVPKGADNVVAELVQSGVQENVEEVEIVSYGIKKPVVRAFFDVLDGNFA